MSFLDTYLDVKGRLSLRLRGHRSQVLSELLRNDLQQMEVQARQLRALEALLNLSAAEGGYNEVLLRESFQDLAARSELLQSMVVNMSGHLDRVETRLQLLEGAVKRSPTSPRIALPGTCDPLQAEDSFEVEVLKMLFPFLADPVALDVGAHQGSITDALSRAGYDVHAIEPYPPSVEVMKQRFRERTGVTVHAMALSDQDGRCPLHVARFSDQDAASEASSYYHRLGKVDLPAGLVLDTQMEVEQARMDTLKKAGRIPERIGVMKVDAEGMDHRILQSLTAQEIPVVMAEFHESGHAFASQHPGDGLGDMIDTMRRKGYPWTLTFRYLALGELSSGYRVEVEVCQSAHEGDAWGNVMLFCDHALFLEAWNWCRMAGEPVYSDGSGG